MESTSSWIGTVLSVAGVAFVGFVVWSAPPPDATWKVRQGAPSGVNIAVLRANPAVIGRRFAPAQAAPFSAEVAVIRSNPSVIGRRFAPALTAGQ